MTLEKQGIPTVLLCSSSFVTLGELNAKSKGLPDLPIVKLVPPGHDQGMSFGLTPRQAVVQMAAVVADQVVDRLVLLRSSVSAR